MVYIREDQWPIMQEAAKSEIEMCGYINKEGLFVERENISEIPYHAFTIDFIDVEEEYTAIVHSHIANSCEPSDEDKLSCFESKVPWLIFGSYGETHEWMNPDDIKFGFLERPFRLGVIDCYTMVQDYYRVLGLSLMDNPRPGEFWERKEEDSNPYIELAPEQGFYRLSDDAALLPHDVILMSIRTKRPCANHAAVYIGSGKILHHLQGRRSCIELYDKRNIFGKLTYAIYRHIKSHEIQKKVVEL